MLTSTFSIDNKKPIDKIDGYPLVQLTSGKSNLIYEELLIVENLRIKIKLK